MEENKEQNKPEIAFNDFKKSVTVDEFESVLDIVTNEYLVLEQLCSHKETFRKEAESTLEKMREQSQGMPPGLLDKLIEGMKRRLAKEVFLKFEKEINRHIYVTDFLNTFRSEDEKLKYLDFKLEFNI